MNPAPIDRSARNLRSELPVWCAPMAGGPSTPELAAAVSNEGGIGFIAAGYLTPEDLERQLTGVEELTTRPYGVNLFLPTADRTQPNKIAAYADELELLARHYAVALGEPTWSDDWIAAKIDVVSRHHPAVISFTFGDPGARVIQTLRDSTDARIAVTITSVSEAEIAADSGADLLIAQGYEAGGHRGIWDDDPTLPDGAAATSMLRLLEQVVAVVELPVVAAGGIMDGRAVAEVLEVGAFAAQLGTAFLCCDEAGTSELYRQALLSKMYGGTAVTRAFTGRPARALRNEFVTTYSSQAPSAYPHLHYMTKPLRARAVAAENSGHINLWAGSNWAAVRAQSVKELMEQLRWDIEPNEAQLTSPEAHRGMYSDPLGRPDLDRIAQPGLTLGLSSEARKLSTKNFIDRHLTRSDKEGQR